MLEIYAKDKYGQRFLFDYRSVDQGTWATDDLAWQLCREAEDQGFTNIEVVYTNNEDS